MAAGNETPGQGQGRDPLDKEAERPENPKKRSFREQENVNYKELAGESTASPSGVVPPFLSKTYEIVENPENQSIIGWAPDGDSFVVLDKAEFEKTVLPRHFK